MKSEPTLIAERRLIERAVRNCSRFALEAEVLNGRADFVEMKIDEYMHMPIFTVYEIKVSMSDFYSPNGHNFVGDYNYYVVPKEMYEKIKYKPEIQYEGIGVYVIGEDNIRLKKKCKRRKSWYTMNFEQRMRTMSNLLKHWCTGSMYKHMERLGVTLANMDEPIGGNIGE